MVSLKTNLLNITHWLCLWKSESSSQRLAGSLREKDRQRKEEEMNRGGGAEGGRERGEPPFALVYWIHFPSSNNGLIFNLTRTAPWHLHLEGCVMPEKKITLWGLGDYSCLWPCKADHWQCITESGLSLVSRHVRKMHSISSLGSPVGLKCDDYSRSPFVRFHLWSHGRLFTSILKSL